MRLLYIVNGNGLSSALGGSTVRSASIARCLVTYGHHVEVLTTAGGKTACSGLGLDVPYHVLPSTPFAEHERSVGDRAVGYLVTSVAGLVSANRFSGFDAIYSDSDYSCDTVPAEMISRRHRVPWIAMVHHIVTENSEDAPFVRNVKGFVQDFALRRIARHASRILAYVTPAGDAVAERVRLFGASATRIERVHNGYDARELELAPTGPSTEAVLVGGLRAGKGLREIVPIWRAVVDRLPSARLRLVGGMTADNKKFLEGEIAQAGLADRIILEGSSSHSRALSLAKAAQLMVAPSLQEGWGIAVCEALACGVPVVAYDLPAYRALFNDGWARVPLRDRRAFADAVVETLTDEQTRKRLGEAGRLAVRQYEWHAVAARDLEIFRAASMAYDVRELGGKETVRRDDRTLVEIEGGAGKAVHDAARFTNE